MIISREQLRKINIIILSVFICLYGYFILSTNDAPYIGIRAFESEEKWKIKRVFAGGVGNDLNLKSGMEIVEINNEPPSENPAINKWLVVEQVDSMVIKDGEEIKKIVFEEGKLNHYIMTIILIVVIVLQLSLAMFSKRGIHCRKMLYFYLFCINLFICFLSILPSSLGGGLARIVFISTISIMPILFTKILAYFLGMENVKRLKKIIFSLYIIGTLNIILSVCNVIFNMELITREYLSIGPITYIIVFLFISTFTFSKYCRKNKIKNIPLQKEIPYLITSCLTPITIFYLLPFGTKTSFLILLIFIGNMVFILIHMLIVSKAIKIRKKFSNRAVKFIITLYLTVITVAITFMSRDISISVLVVFIFLEFYPILTMLIEIVKIFGNVDNSSDSLSIFNAEEREREEISTYIHDTVIQEIIYFSITVSEKDGKLNNNEVINLLDDVIYSLRKLCSEIYPIMISEIGLVNTVKHIIDEFMKKHSVTINFINIKCDEEKFTNEEKNFILRSVRELINNSIKHGRATLIKVTFYEENKDMVFMVSDNGEYINSNNLESIHFGVNSIRSKLKLINGKITYNIENGTKAKIIIGR